jgi:hypothetical protein
MKIIFSFLILALITKSYSQNLDTIKLSKLKLCLLTVDYLKQKDSSIKQTKVVEMDMCSDGFIQDSRFENRIGYETLLFPGVIFQKYEANGDAIAKIHLTKKFKGYLPNGRYVDLSNLKAKDILTQNNTLDSWTSRGCSDYWGIIDNKQIYYYVEIDKNKEPRYPVDEKFYSEQLIVGIDIVSDCYAYNKSKKINDSPLFIIDVKKIKPSNIETLIVLKGQNAFEKYGEKGINGVIEIYLKTKK